MTALTLLSLPDELLIQILLHLSPSDILAAQLTSHYLNTTVAHSISLQYQTLLKAAQYADNPSSPLSLSDRLAVLKRREEAWVSLRPTFTKAIEVEQTSGIYDIAGGAYHLGDEAKRNLFWVQLPAQEGDKPEWRTIDMGAGLFVVDIGLCIYEHDLIGVVTTSPHPSTLATYTTQLHLLRFSASSSSPRPTPHPLARQNPLHILDSPHTRSSIGLEIVGDHLVLILIFPFALEEPDRVFVYNWRSGHLVARFSAPHESYYGLVFLNEHWFLLPNAREGRLEVYEIPTCMGPDVDDAIGTGLAPIHVLTLPALAEGCNFGSITCRGEPNPFGNGSTKLHMTMPCYPSPEDAIIIVCIFIRGGQQPFVHPQFGHSFSMYVHRRAVLEVCRMDSLARSAAGLSNQKPSLSSGSTSTFTPLPIPYRVWGRPVTRWFNTDEIPTMWITTTAGQRAVIISAEAEEQASPYVVLDFNQGNVQRAKKALGYCDEQDDLHEATGRRGTPPVELMVIDDEIDSGDELEDEYDSELVEILNEHPEYAVAFALPGFSAPLDAHSPDTITDAHSSPSQPMPSPAPLPPPNRWLTTTFQSVQPAKLFNPSEGPVGGSLPYVACSSAEGYTWDGVMMDGERVVGVVMQRPESRERLQVHVFG